MRHVIGLLALPLVALGCQRASSEAPPPPRKTDSIPFTEQAALLPAIAVSSLTLTPIVATDAGMPKEDLDVITLDEAFGQKLVTIKEQENETVNSLTLTNTADRPMFLLAGEVILGGKQDRIIGQNTIIAANSTLSVPVFCVEHGRWDNSSKVFTTGKALAHGRLRGRASFEGQSEVWNEVAQKNQLRDSKTASDTYRGVAQQQQQGPIAASEQQVTAALARVQPLDRERMIGYVVSLNGKIATVDMFDSPRLFKKLETKLVRSYLTEAIDIPPTPGAKPPTVADVTTFMADADKAVAETSYDNPAATTVRFKGSDRANKAEVEYKPLKPGKRAGKIYKTYQAK